LNTTIAQAIAAIAANNQQGAAEVAEQGADVLLRCSHLDDAATAADFRQRMLQTGWAIIRAQPTMAPLVNLVNTLLWKLENCDALPLLRQTVASLTTDFKRLLHVHEAAIAEAALPLIPDGGWVLTCGRSSTVRAALLHGQRAGRRFRVCCAEGRPGYEGRLMASDLSARGIPCMVVTDVLALSKVAEVNVVLVGADHLSNKVLVNKAGTYGLALAAQHCRQPIYALCSSEKFLPPGYHLPDESHWPPEQVWADPPPHVQVENLFFDRTPLTFLSGIVTEQGILPTVGIEAWLAATRLHRALAVEPTYSSAS
jgi:translation initiation factor 2B subunit (eIF-2B alpha/beta/delta family)